MALQGVPGAINSNDYATHRASYRLAKVLVMRLRGSACFDFEYYRSRSRDLSSWPHAQLWDHFVQDGQFEGRSFRWGGRGASLSFSSAIRQDMILMQCRIYAALHGPVNISNMLAYMQVHMREPAAQ